MYTPPFFFQKQKFSKAITVRQIHHGFEGTDLKRGKSRLASSQNEIFIFFVNFHPRKTDKG